MSKRKKIESNPLNLTCSWKDCSTAFHSPELFYSHISDHLNDLNGVSQSENSSDAEEYYGCQWEKCSFCSQIYPQMVRHVKYHGYHTILKAKGSQVMEMEKLPHCTYSEEDTILPQQLHSIVCLWDSCNEDCAGIKEMIDHVAFLHMGSITERLKSYNCEWRGCKLSFGKKVKLVDHMKVHTGEKRLACPQCGNCFANKTKFVDHCRRQVPVDEQSSQCSYCYSYLPTARLLREHMRQHVHHYKCNFCGMTCHTPGILKRHIKYRHSRLRNYTCALCPYKCKSYTDLRQHLLNHSHNKFTELSCSEPNCDFETKLQYVLTRHIYQEHSENNKGGRFCCHLCSKSYAKGFSLTKHLCSVHNVRKPSEYSRFIYKSGEDGCNRLQTIRLESLEVAESDKNMMDYLREEEVDNPPDIISSEKDIEKMDIAESITIDVVDESGHIILSNNVDTVIGEASLPPDAKIVAIGQ